jgi:hypothetical protein
MSESFSRGLGLGMNLARDVRSANLAAAERRERSKYRDREDKRAERSLELQENRDKRDERRSKREKRESDQRIKSLKSGMKRSRKKDKEQSKESKLSRQLLGQQLQAAKRKNRQSKNPTINKFRENAAALEDYKKMLQAADARHAAQLAPVLQQLESMERAGNMVPRNEYFNIVAVRDSMINQHKDFKAGLEQAFMSASSQPHTGSYSIRPFQDPFGGGISYGVVGEGMSSSEVEATLGKFREAGTRATYGNTGTPAQPVTPVDPNDPLTIRRNTNATTP